MQQWCGCLGIEPSLGTYHPTRNTPECQRPKCCKHTSTANCFWASLAVAWGPLFLSSKCFGLGNCGSENRSPPSTSSSRSSYLFETSRWGRLWWPRLELSLVLFTLSEIKWTANLNFSSSVAALAFNLDIPFSRRSLIIRKASLSYCYNLILIIVDFEPFVFLNQSFYSTSPPECVTPPPSSSPPWPLLSYHPPFRNP